MVLIFRSLYYTGNGKQIPGHNYTQVRCFKFVFILNNSLNTTADTVDYKLQMKGITFINTNHKENDEKVQSTKTKVSSFQKKQKGIKFKVERIPDVVTVGK